MTLVFRLSLWPKQSAAWFAAVSLPLNAGQAYTPAPRSDGGGLGSSGKGRPRAPLGAAHVLLDLAVAITTTTMFENRRPCVVWMVSQRLDFVRDDVEPRPCSRCPSATAPVHQPARLPRVRPAWSKRCALAPVVARALAKRTAQGRVATPPMPTMPRMVIFRALLATPPERGVVSGEPRSLPE